MEAYQQRVVDEHAELGTKIGRLLVFLGTSKFHDLDHEEQERMQRQYIAMKTYSEVLAERLAAFNTPSAT